MNTILPNGVNQDLQLETNNQGTTEYQRYEPTKMQWSRPGQGSQDIEGVAALYSARDQYGMPIYNGADQFNAQSQARGFNDIRDTAGFGIGKAIRNTLMGDQNGVSRYVGNMPKSLKTALVAGGAGALASWIANKVNGYDDITPLPAALMLGSAAAGGQMYLDNQSRKLNQQQAFNNSVKQIYNQMNPANTMFKQSSLYRDPRNFVLEKLQRDESLSMADKAMLVGKIRTMDIQEAADLEKSVRKLLGVGVGDMLMKYFKISKLRGLLSSFLG